MDHILIKNLTHKIGRAIILDHINICVPAGAIYGFLGPNGAGKTTTLRLILGLLKKQQGDILIFGKTFEESRIAILSKIGSLIENPSVYAHLTAKENLLVWQKIYQCPLRRIGEVLEIVGLGDTGGKRAGSFSLGMKQRLGLAIALLNQPSLLILDEPTNGLDPNGIIELRQLLLQLNQQGITILISSHLLPELEKIITHAGIIHHGRMLFHGTIDELKASQTCTVVIATNDNIKAMALLDGKFRYRSYAAKIEITLPQTLHSAQLVRLLVQNGIDVYEVTPGNTNLEAAFINLVK